MEQQVEKRKLLIIKSHPQSLVPVENFLKNRDWEIRSTHNLKEAMVFLVQNQPQFVMVSIDHPNKKVRNLPKVLSQAFPVCVIAFAEHSTANSVKVLNDCNSGYAIYHPITGPAVERMVNKYLKDQSTNPAAAAAQRSWEGGGNGAGVISIRGEGGGAEGATSTQNFLANLMGALDGNSVAGGGNNSFATGMNSDSIAAIQPGMAGYIPPTSQDPNANGNVGGSNQNGFNGFLGGTNNSHEPGAYGSGGMQNGGNANGANGASNNGDPQFAGGMNSPNGSYGQNGNGSQGHNPYGGNGSSPSGAGYNGSNPSSANGDTLDPNDPNYDPYGDAGPSSSANRKKSDTVWAPIEGDSKKNALRTKEIADEVAKDPSSLILQGTREAMEKSCFITSKEHSLEQPTNVACILVESGRFSGYLVAAMAEHKTIDIQFFDQIRTRLFKFLADNGENMENNETMPIKIKQVPFTAWAVEYAEFLRKSVHEGNEVAMAFFPRADVKTEVSKSADEEMAAIKIQEMRENVPVEFNLYVFLPRNNRYVLYTPEGGVFLSEQKNRLISQGITHLHVLRMELQNVDKYRAQNYLNDKIDQYQEQLEKEANPNKKLLAS
ncbi:hypothetical protein ACLVWU_13185 [Bdellovibrio sp. HCB290]|uniref:hypothetical protein n=1 Tax=Bdellovibrio sp. HCB290 TaxID=3394356 RepID=UPI0039B6A51B